MFDNVYYRWISSIQAMYRCMCCQQSLWYLNIVFHRLVYSHLSNKKLNECSYDVHRECSMAKNIHLTLTIETKKKRTTMFIRKRWSCLIRLLTLYFLVEHTDREKKKKEEKKNNGFLFDDNYQSNIAHWWYRFRNRLFFSNCSIWLTIKNCQW
jgi:hypothetical protein